MEDNGRVLFPNEIDSYLESLQTYDISEIGSTRWFQQQDRIYKLSLQATVDVKSGNEEIVKDEIVVHQKVPVLIHELIIIELWRLKILPHLLKLDCVTKSSIPLYAVLYNEITLVSFLEILSFHEDAVETANDSLVDLVDYCYRKIVIFKSINSEDIQEDTGNLDETLRILELKKKIDFESGIKCISILSCMTQHKKILPLSVLHRMLFLLIPLLFTDLMCDPSWLLEKDGQTERYVDGKWKNVSRAELLKLSKVEGQENAYGKGYFEALERLPLSVLHRMLVVHDIPILFTDLLCDPPWLREKDGQTERYVDGKWKKVSRAELLKLGKVEGQLWISLIQLLLDPECQKKYDMSDYRKSQILRLRSKINEIVMDQIPILNEMLRYLEHLNLFNAPVPKTGIVIQQIPEIWERIRETNRGKWKDIAKKQADEYFSMSETQLQEFCKRMSESFDVKNIEAMLQETPVCGNCHGKGEKRCSRCRNEWYCGRSCQVSHWAKHKPACDLMANEK